MNGRIVIAEADYASLTAATDLLEVLFGAAQAGFLIRAEVEQKSEVGAVDDQKLPISLFKATGSYTSGSGGGTADVYTPTNNVAHGLAVFENNNTTQAAAGSGALTKVPSFSGNFNVLQAEWFKAPVPQEWLPIGPSEGVVLRIPAPATAIELLSRLIFFLTHG